MKFKKSKPPKKSKCRKCAFLHKKRNCEKMKNFDLINVMGCGSFARRETNHD